MPDDRFYHTAVWKALRLRALQRDHYFCQSCKRRGKLFVPANTVHHKISRDEAPELALVLENVESICPACHNRKHPEKSFRKSIQKNKYSKRIRVIKM